MTTKIVEITAFLVEQALTTGYHIHNTIISKGLDPDSKLTDARINEYGNLELVFTRGKEDIERIDIELTTLTNPLQK